MVVQFSIQKMVSDGTLSTIALGIQYLQRDDIFIRVGGEETPASGASNGFTWSFINNTTLKILPVVPNGVEVVVYRRTDVDAMYNVYSQNAQFDEATIDENNQQLLYIAQEYLEQGIPGAGVDTLEFIRDDGSFTYYRIKRTDGSYSDEFYVPSAGSITKVLARESLRRSYAEAGYYLVAGSFEAGGTLSNAHDVLLQESTGKAFSGPLGIVPAGTDPVSGGFVDRSQSTIRGQLSAIDGLSLIGGSTYPQIRAYSGDADILLCVGASGADLSSAGVFIRDTSDTTTPDDDGCVLVGVGGVRWKRLYDGGRPAAAYGVSPSNADNTTQLNKAVSVGGAVIINDGFYKYSDSITTDYSDINFPPVGTSSKRVDILGSSIGNTILEYSGSNPAFVMAGMGSTLAQGIHSTDRFGNMTLVRKDYNKTGVGVKLNSKAHFKIENLASIYFSYGMFLSGCLTGSIENTYLIDGVIGLGIDRSAYTIPNALSFNNVYFKTNSQCGAFGLIGGGNSMNGCTCEGNGDNAIPNSGGMIFSIDGSNGSAALSINSCYFENNAGIADLYLDNISADHVTVTLTSCIFTRLSNTRYTTNNIVLTSSGGGGITLVTNGCTFESKGSYVPSAVRGFVKTSPGCQWVDNGSEFSETTSLGSDGAGYPTASSRTTCGRVAPDGTAIVATVGTVITRTGVGSYNLKSTNGRRFGKDQHSYHAQATAIASIGAGRAVSCIPVSGTEVNIFVFNTTNGAGVDGDFSWSITTLS